MSTKWGAEDYEKAAELCERTGSLHDNDGAYADMLRHASAALTAAAEREKQLLARVETLEQENGLLQHQWHRECYDTDRLIQSALGLNPMDYRSEGGSLLVEKLRNYLVGDRV